MDPQQTPIAAEAGLSRGPHPIYLAVIAVLVIVIVALGAKFVKTRRTLHAAVKPSGLTDIPIVTPRTNPLRDEPEDPAKLQALSLLQKQVYEVGVRAIPEVHELVGSRAHSDSGHLEASLVLEVARAGNLSRVNDAREDDEPTIPIDAAEAALAVEYLAASMFVGPPGMSPVPMGIPLFISAAFQCICRQVDWIRQNCPDVPGVDRTGMQMSGYFSSALRSKADIAWKMQTIQNPSSLMVTNALAARSSLFELACITGWTAVGGDVSTLRQIRLAGRHFGISHRIFMDIKEWHGVGQIGSWNFVNVVGMQAARNELDRNLSACRLVIGQCGIWSPVWENLFAIVTENVEPKRKEGEGQPERAAEEENQTQKAQPLNVQTEASAPVAAPEVSS